MRVGGGIGGIILLVIVFLLNSQLGGGSSGAGGSGGETTSSLESCTDGAAANHDRSCALVADVNSIQAYWDQALPEQSGTAYEPAVTNLFSGRTDTGCGPASSDVGPFYCPVDKNVYLDVSFFEQMLQGQLGARGGPFSEAYVLAHEYGHHVQDLLGQMGKVRTQQGASSDAVRLELQADCYAGMWSKHATEVPDASGEPFILDLTEDDIARALDAARAVGDDRIQQRSGGQVDPDRWTHGSAEQRMRWFRTGLDQGTLEACDTFSASTL
ncbi:KPN_02809 family neutral zinc metallopeptidase [Nocardioides mesophilus]|uniref:KPN_02809 family neutral zinc metallopeptidase n=1 Tax=Nocardioides mesophilus TaxID=433659 RepID=UPI001FEC9A68|nr:neutral zinc metallopeptidase [Nocardioides mesophilus]